MSSAGSREATLAQMLRLIEWPTASHRLVAAIVARAVLDLEMGGRHAASAAAYIYGGGLFVRHCVVLGLSPEYVRRLLAAVRVHGGCGTPMVTA